MLADTVTQPVHEEGEQAVGLSRAVRGVLGGPGDSARVYAADAVHEFPFTCPGLPSRLLGRNEIVSFIAAGWQACPLKYQRYRTLAIHDTSDPETIIVEQEVLGTSASAGTVAGIGLLAASVPSQNHQPRLPNAPWHLSP
jgi:hypothetical protein